MVGTHFFYECWCWYTKIVNFLIFCLEKGFDVGIVVPRLTWRYLLAAECSGIIKITFVAAFRLLRWQPGWNASDADVSVNFLTMCELLYNYCMYMRSKCFAHMRDCSCNTISPRTYEINAHNSTKHATHFLTVNEATSLKYLRFKLVNFVITSSLVTHKHIK